MQENLSFLGLQDELFRDSNQRIDLSAKTSREGAFRFVKLVPIMARNLTLTLAGTALLACCVSAHGQKFLPKSIRFIGDPDYSNDELLAASGLKKGAVLSYSEMNDTSKRLMDSGMFASLSFKFDGQDLTFQLTPADQLVPIEVDNLPLASNVDVNAKLHQQLPLFHDKVPTEGGLLEQVRSALEETLAAQGIRASVLATPAADPRTHHVNAMHFGIASPAVRVEIKSIEGASAEFQEKLHGVATEAAKPPFDSDNSAATIERAFGVFYQDRGHAAVKVTAERAGEVAVGPDAIVVPYAVRIQEGSVYKVGAVHLPDEVPVTPGEISKALAATPNGPVEGVRVRSLWSLIAQRYHAKGYLDCKITATPNFDEATTTVNYDVAIELGPVYHLAFVKFDNVSDQLRAMLMHNWQLMPGDPFNETYVANFISAVQQNDPVLKRTLANVKTSFDATADPQTHDVNVVIRLAKQ